MSKNQTNWENITDILIDEFSQNIYHKDEKVPSENELAVRFEVPRTEIRRAYNRLKELGYIYSVQGRGSFFSGINEKIPLLMTDTSGFSEKMQKLDVNYRSENLGIEKLDKNSAFYHAMNAEPSEVLYKITRLRCIDNSPAAIHISYVSEKSFPHIHTDGPHITSFFEYVRQCGYHDFYNKNSEIEVAALTPQERKLLQVPGYAPCLVLSSQCINRENNQILEIARTIYRSDKFIFML